MRTRRGKYTHNESVFDSITTEVQAWLLGWIATDGNIFENALTIRLKAADCGVLEKMKQILGTDAPVTSHTRPGDGYDYAGLRIHSAKIVTDLAQLGIHPRKSFTVKPWAGPSHLLSAYWRGAFEGDGTIGNGTYIRHTNAYTSWRVGFCGNFWMVQGFSDFISARVKTRARPATLHNIYRINYEGSRLAKAVVRVLYDSATVWLDRKKRLADELTCSQYERHYKLTNQQRDQIVTCFLSGSRPARIAERFRCTLQNVLALLKRRGVRN